MSILEFSPNLTLVKHLTKRELFAALAMQGMLATNGKRISDMAEFAVVCADELLKELNKPVEQVNDGR